MSESTDLFGKRPGVSPPMNPASGLTGGPMVKVAYYLGIGALAGHDAA